MSSLGKITEAHIREVLTASSLRRARRYLNRVKKAVRTGQTLTAEVKGTRLYQVEIEVEPAGITANCSCPYDWGGYCKHIGAVLLKWIQSPVSFTIREAPVQPEESLLELRSVAPPPTYRPDELPDWLARPFDLRQEARLLQLRDWLSELSLRDLRAIASRRNWRVNGNRKDDVVAQMVQLIADPAEVRSALGDLDGEARELLAALVLLDRGDHVRIGDLEYLLQIRGDKKKRSRMVEGLNRLMELGLALPGELEANYPPRNDFCPELVARWISCVPNRLLPAGYDPEPDLEITLADPTPLVRLANLVVLLLSAEKRPLTLRAPMPRPKLEHFYPNLKGWDYDPAEILRAKEEGLLRPYSALTLRVPPPQSPLPEATIARLMPVVGDWDKLDFIFHLLVAVGVFQPGSPLTAWPGVGERLLSQDELGQRAVLARTYFYLWSWNELWEMLRASANLELRRRYTSSRPENLLADLTSYRVLALRLLALLPEGEWIRLAEVDPLLRRIWPDFDSKTWESRAYRHEGPRWFIASSQDREPLDPASEEHWASAQGAYLRRMIAGPLHWLGLADLGRDAAGRLVAVRFHGLADLFWDRIESPPAPHPDRAPALPPAADAVRVDGDRVTLAPAFVTAQSHRFLQAIGRLEDASVERFVYRLDPQAVHATFEAGGTLDEILEDWPLLLQVPLPAEWRRKLSDWWGTYGLVRIYEDLTVIEFGDDGALQELKLLSSLQEVMIAEITPRLVIIPREAVSSLAAELERAGYTPKQTEGVQA
jgi:hypothetical protein